MFNVVQENVAHFSENHSTLINDLYGINAKFSIVKVSGTQ
jgi:hypothetical protein